MTQRRPIPLVDDIVDQRTGKASQSWSRWFQDANNTLVTINDYLLNLAASNTGTSSGTNTGDQTITLSGAVTGSGTGAITTAFGSTFTVPEGGTGLTTMTTAYAPLCAGTTATGALQVASTGLGTSGYVLTSNGSSAVPSFQAIPTDSDDWVKISAQTASSSATIDFTDLSSTYRDYVIVYSTVQPATDNVAFYLRTSSDNGSTYDSAAGSYSYSRTGFLNGATATASSDSATFIEVIGAALGNAATESSSGWIRIHNPSSSSAYPLISTHMTALNTATQLYTGISSGARRASAAIDGIRILLSSGNIASGEFTLYGIRA